MKYFLLILTLITSLNSIASDNYLLFCLGQEEKIIHQKKQSGAYNKLNREMISELLQLPKTVKLNDKYLEVVCDKNNSFKSLSLLKFILLRGNTFYSSVDTNSIKEYAIDMRLIKQLKIDSIKLLIIFINAIQAESPKVDCLQKKIPELRVFYQNGRYLLEDVGFKDLIENKHNYELIFKKITAPNLFKDC